MIEWGNVRRSGVEAICTTHRMLRSVIPNMHHPGQAFFSMGPSDVAFGIWNHQS